jgi:hypothetical protein
MPRTSPAHGPQLTSRTVFFIGNGVLRVAAGNAGRHQDRPFRSPSWAEYMDNLWSFIKLSLESPGYLSLADFSQLPAPRQAEWFDREFRELLVFRSCAAAAGPGGLDGHGLFGPLERVSGVPCFPSASSLPGESRRGGGGNSMTAAA